MVYFLPESLLYLKSLPIFAANKSFLLEYCNKHDIYRIKLAHF